MKTCKSQNSASFKTLWHQWCLATSDLMVSAWANAKTRFEWKLFILVFGYCHASLLLCIYNGHFLSGWILKLLWKHLEAILEASVCTHLSVHDVTWLWASIDAVAFCVIHSWTVWSRSFYWAASSSWLLPPLLRKLPSLIIRCWWIHCSSNHSVDCSKAALDFLDSNFLVEFKMIA